MYLDSIDPYWINQPSKPIIQKPTKKKDDSIINNKVLVIFGIIAIVKIAVLILWI